MVKRTVTPSGVYVRAALFPVCVACGTVDAPQFPHAEVHRSGEGDPDWICWACWRVLALSARSAIRALIDAQRA